MSKFADAFIKAMMDNAKPSDDFGERLRQLCTIESLQSNGDTGRRAAMIERLTNALATTLALTGEGNAAGTSELVEGTAAYLLESTTKISGDVGKLMRALRE